MIRDRTRNNILFSCLGQEKSDFDPFIVDHAITFVIHGKMLINDGNQTLEIRQGDVCFVHKNQLVKTKKIPESGHDFSSISIFLPKETLFDFSRKFEVLPQSTYAGHPNFLLQKNDILKGFLQSMLPYFENPERLSDYMAYLKTMEVIEMVLPEDRMKNILFRFEEDYKLDLEVYMNKYFMHNIPLEQFARLTGRSISTFKRDFQQIFQMTPNKWLIKKRLDYAYHLIHSKNKKPYEVYYEAGFINFSHFSKSFKEEFGINPSRI